MAGSGARIVSVIDRISIATGRAVAWLTLAMVLATFLIVMLRYAVGTGAVWLQESVTWMHAVVFMLGAAYTLQRDEHVRVDVFYRTMGRRRQAIVDIAGVLFFVFPMCAFFLIEGYDYVRVSWQIHEVSRDSGGLPYPFLPLLKSALLVMPATVMLQGLSMLLASVRAFREER